MSTTTLDELDGELIGALAASPRASVVELARRLGVARGTVQARMDKLVSRRVITGFGPEVCLAALGYDVVAFVTLEIAQGRQDHVVAHLIQIPEVLECHSITGPGDLLLRVAARTNEALQEVLQRILQAQGIVRTQTVIAMTTQIALRTLPLVETAANGPRRARGRRSA